MRSIRWMSLALILCVLAGSVFAERRKPLEGTPIGQLQQLITEKGEIAVIVGVDLGEDWKPEPSLDAEGVRRQRAAIEEKRAAALKRHPKVRPVPGVTMRTLPYFLVIVDREGLRSLLADDAIASITVNAEWKPTLAQSVGRIHATPSSVGPYDGTNQTIVVIDSGVNKNHRFFGNRVIAEACFSSALEIGSSEICPNVDASGQYPDSPSSVKDTGSNAGMPCTIDASVCDHGTQVAGIAVGKDDGSIGFSGVAPGASLVPIQVFSNHHGAATAWEIDVLHALEYIADELRPNLVAEGKPIAAVNISLDLRRPTYYDDETACGNANPEIRDAIRQLWNAGIAVVAGAGNYYSPTWGIALPACMDKAIAVGATVDTSSNAVAGYSNTGPLLDLWAPGGNWNPFTREVIAGEGIVTSSNNPAQSVSYESYGTSYAAPHVAGAFALLRHKFPTATIGTLYGYLQQTGTPITDNRRSTSITRPLINVGAAMNSDTQAPTAPGAFSAVTTAVANGVATVTLDWTESSDDVGVSGYAVERKSIANLSEAWTVVNPDVDATEYADQVAEENMYAYRIRAFDAAGNGTYSTIDGAVGVFFTDGAINANEDPIKGIHVGELRRAIDAWRVFSGLSTAFPSYGPQTGDIKAAHFAPLDPNIKSLVGTLNEARSALATCGAACITLPNAGTFAYSGGETPAVGGAIRAKHVQELRETVK